MLNRSTPDQPGPEDVAFPSRVFVLPEGHEPNRYPLAPTDLLRISTPADVTTPPRRLLSLRVVDGVITAEYDPADLDEAARLFVDAAARQWITVLDANRRYTADTLATVLRAAAQDQGDGDTISVDHAARIVASLLWKQP
ncbi:hypothetical protein AB0F93_00560 [Micromonospora tulbaghiae]|uniref:hypothetical protein n=1 Tax=Micromonospora tulbaghiae TaxID=479978 RepID=UPI00331FEF34